ncbi:MAG: hypothetical protein DMG11_22755 [Acidobacteria bacterium]|nr:MAG: hypothetical protein DMG11_22755 [Acidobacteriota bacterium]
MFSLFPEFSYLAEQRVKPRRCVRNNRPRLENAKPRIVVFVWFHNPVLSRPRLEKCTLRIPYFPTTRKRLFLPRMLYFAFMPSKLQGRLPYILLVAAILVLDRWTKALVQARFGLNDSVTVIDGFFDITYVRNTGVAFGIFDLVSLPAKSILLSAFTALAAVVVTVYSVRSPARNRLLQVALALAGKSL